ncbi:MAG: hypothetical protein U5K70_00300 [Halodesulfurarchaeum sp.]|nr:hypothetical protein [Halodesulfurarchaeum sp.]
MELSGDQLAGIVDQFGALSPPEMRRAIRETAFRAGVDLDEETIEEWIDQAQADFSLLKVELDGDPLVVPGPRAFPEVPESAGDLPHVLDVDPRTVPEETLETGLRNRLAAKTATIEDPDRAHDLIDVTYDAEAWAGIDLGDVRERLADLAEQET